MTGEFTVEDLEKMFSNPFYAITIDPIFAVEHKPMVTKEEWIKVNLNVIKEIGLEKWLTLLLDNLEGSYVQSDK